MSAAAHAVEMDDTKSETDTNDADYGDLNAEDDGYDSDFGEYFDNDDIDDDDEIRQIQVHLRGRSSREIFFLSSRRESTLRSQTSLSSLFDMDASTTSVMDGPPSEESVDSSRIKNLPSAAFLAEVMSGSVQFSYTAFFREFLYNLFHPIGLPVVLYLEGDTGARSRGYYGFQYGVFFIIIGLIYNIVPWVLWYLYWTAVPTGHYGVEFVFMNVLYISRNTAVAIKWAYQPEEVFDYMREKTLNPAQVSMLHLLQGWANVQPMALAREILQSSGRLKVDISKFKMKFRDDKKEEIKEEKKMKGDKEWKKKMEDKMKSKFTGESYCFCKTVAEPVRGDFLIPYLLFMTSRNFTGHVAKKKKFAVIMAVAISLLPTIYRMVQLGRGDPHHQVVKSGPVIAFNVLLVLYTTMIFWLQLLFISIVALDFKRRSELQVFCTRLIQPGRNAFVKQLDNNYKAHLWPRRVQDDIADAQLQSIDLTHAETVFYWAQTRRFFMDYGLRWLRREEGLLSLYCVLILFFEAGVIAILFLFQSVYTLNAGELVMAFTTLVVIGLPVTTAMSLGQRINYSRDKQRAILSEKRLRMHNEALFAVGAYANWNSKRLNRAVEMINKIMEMLKHGRYTITFLGFRIDVTVTSLVASVLGSIGLTLARFLTSSNGRLA